MAQEYTYQVFVRWTGNTGKGTIDSRSFERSLLISAEGKISIQGSSDPSFRGDATMWNPEELLLSSLSTCHMLWYLGLCASQKIVVKEYTDEPTGEMTIDQSGKGAFKKVILRPKIVIEDPSHIEKARKVHEDAHSKCFIANSVNFVVEIEPQISAG